MLTLVDAAVRCPSVVIRRVRRLIVRPSWPCGAGQVRRLKPVDLRVPAPRPPPSKRSVVVPRPLSVVIGGVLLLVTSATAWSQPPPSSYPIQGRFACLGYDRDLAAVGDLGSALPGGMGGGQNNGFFYVYPSRNVTYSVADGAWDVELGIWTGTNYVWVRSIEPGEQCAYYPEVLGSLPDPHAWLVGPLDTSALWPTGWLRVHTYDGTLKIPGDAYGGIPHDGILFALPAQQAHIIRGATPMWHLQIQVTNTLGVLEWVWAVYPKAMSHVDVTP